MTIINPQLLPFQPQVDTKNQTSLEPKKKIVGTERKQEIPIIHTHIKQKQNPKNEKEKKRQVGGHRQSVID